MGDQDGYATLAVNRLSNDFVVKDDSYKKNTFMFKGGKKMGKFSLDGIATYINATTDQTDSKIFYDLLQTPNSIPVEAFSSGSFYDHWTVWRKSPYWTVKNMRYGDNDNTFTGNLNLGYEFNKNI